MTAGSASRRLVTTAVVVAALVAPAVSADGATLAAIHCSVAMCGANHNEVQAASARAE